MEKNKSKRLSTDLQGFFDKAAKINTGYYCHNMEKKINEAKRAYKKIEHTILYIE